MAIDLERIPAFFAQWIAANGQSGPAGEVARWLASGELDPTGFEEIADRHGAAREDWFRKNMLDLILDYARYRLADGQLTIDDITDIRLLKYALHIEEGQFFLHRPAEISAFLQAALEGILEDDRIDPAEELYLVGVQAAFDLSYDQYLALARPALERAVAGLEMRLADVWRMSRQRDGLLRKREALEPVHRLAEMQYRSLGALY